MPRPDLPTGVRPAVRLWELVTTYFECEPWLASPAECDARNVASARLLERVGFTREGLRRRHTWIKGEWTDDLLYGLLEEDFFGVATTS